MVLWAKATFLVQNFRCQASCSNFPPNPARSPVSGFENLTLTKLVRNILWTTTVGKKEGLLLVENACMKVVLACSDRKSQIEEKSLKDDLEYVAMTTVKRSSHCLSAKSHHENTLIIKESVANMPCMYSIKPLKCVQKKKKLDIEKDIVAFALTF